MSQTITRGLAEQRPCYTHAEATMEAQRCLYCYDAPCVHACPTHIDIPSFIRKVATGNPAGAGRTILRSNLLGATCARVCPVEELCEGACVLHGLDRAIEIGRLQRFSTDHLAAVDPDPFQPGPPTGHRVLVVGAGPAGLSAAGELAKLGHEVTIWERQELPGGLSTYGIIPIREPLGVAVAEAAMISRLGVQLHTGNTLSDAAQLRQATDDFDAVFLAIGLGEVPNLDIPGAEHIRDGLAYIAAAKLADAGRGPTPTEAQARRVVVIGAGNTGIDAATIAIRRGAQAHIIYRRTAAEMPAYQHEYHFARSEGIEFSFLTQPIEILTTDGVVTGLRCIHMELGEPDTDGRRRPVPAPDAEFTIEADLVVRAIGQRGYHQETAFGLELNGSYLATDPRLRTSNPQVWAGGDAIRATGAASTVMAVQDGKLAAESIHAYLGTLGGDHG